MGLFGSLNTSYSGLLVNEVATDVISNNIANAETEGYTRQRVNIQSSSMIDSSVGPIGTGADAVEIIRIHDEFAYKKFRNTSSELQYDSFMQDQLREISKLYPDIDEVGLQKNINEYFDSWQKVAASPNDAAQKIVLAKNSERLARDIREIRKDLVEMQESLDEQLVTTVKEVNRLAEEIAGINSQIQELEGLHTDHANSLRDRRDQLEIAMYELIDPNVIKVGTAHLADIDPNIADYDEHYAIEVGGYPIVDDSSFHPIEIQTTSEDGAISNIYYKSSDHSLTDVTDKISGGKAGAILDLRGREFDTETSEPADGLIHDYIEDLDVFARALIQNTNNLYAQSATTVMQGDLVGDSVSLSAGETTSVVKQLGDKLKGKVQEGTLTISTYDIQGFKDQKDIEIRIDPTTESLKTIVGKINDEFKARDIDAQASIKGGVLTLTPEAGNNGTRTTSAVLIKDDSSLLTDALGMTASLPLKEVDAIDLPFDIENGNFDINVFDSDGNIVSTRTIRIDKGSEDPLYSTIEGINSQINMKYRDDNKDNDLGNDVDDVLLSRFGSNRMSIQVQNPNSNYQFNIVDHGTGFPGAMGMSKYFEGNSAKTVTLNEDMLADPDNIQAYSSPVLGNNDVANAMVQLQYDEVNFYYDDGTTRHDTFAKDYRFFTGKIAEQAKAAEMDYETTTALYNAAKEKHESIASVNLDEELTNLIRFQTGYSANAKVISTIDQMLDTLLSLKR